MLFRELELRGAWLLQVELIQDDRGAFGRTFCQREFLAHGMRAVVDQCNVSINLKRGTLRGMHFQAAPHCEAKLIRVVRGAIIDVIIDLRKESPTYLQSAAIPLRENDAQLIYVPEDFAHGFQTLEDNTEVTYQMSKAYHATSTRGFRWDDPAFDIRWPLPNPILSPRDATAPPFSESLLEPQP